jgi:hypothetical protein
MGVAMLVAAAAGCGDDGIRVYDVPKPASPPPSRLPPGHPPIGTPSRGGGAMDPAGLPPEASEAAPRDLAWTLPAGWRESPGSGMRVATFAIAAGGGKAEMSVIALPGDAGGTLANVNRWRGQIGLAEIGEADLARDATRVRSPAGEAIVVGYDGPGGKDALIGALLVRKGRTWFFKATGPAAVLAAARPDFFAFVKGLRAR